MGWLSKEVERTIAAWFDAHSADGQSAVLAEHVVRWKRSTLDGDQLTTTLSLQELCDQIEGPPEHRVIITAGNWKMTHPLSCRMAGLVHCTVAVEDDLYIGEWAWRDNEWVDTAGESSPS